jgi:hypothetical protein
MKRLVERMLEAKLTPIDKIFTMPHIDKGMFPNFAFYGIRSLSNLPSTLPPQFL